MAVSLPVGSMVWMSCAEESMSCSVMRVPFWS